MDYQSDGQKQPLQEQHQRLQEQNIVYIQQDSQNYKNPSYYEGPTDIIGNLTSFQDQNAGFGQFENHYPLVTNGHFSSPNPSATIISNSGDASKSKNVSIPIRSTQYLSDNDSDSAIRHQRNDVPVQFANGNFQSVDFQSLNYQQASQYFLQNLGNHYRLNDNLVPTYQSSGSSESSDESSISNASQPHYSSDSSGISNNQFEFPIPIPTTNQIGQNHQFQQKDFWDNYMALLQQDPQVPRCDSSKSEATESTCSSLSSGSTESQSENENVLRLPLLVNPLLNNNGNYNILHSYQSNIHNNISSYSNSIEQNENNEFQKNYTNHSHQNILKYNNFDASTINAPNLANENINNNVNNILPSNNEVNNLVVMLPNRLNKSYQNCVQSHNNQPVLQNPSSQDVLSSSKFVIQSPNQKVNHQQKIYGLINVTNPASQDKLLAPVQLNQMIKVNRTTGNQENFSGNECIGKKMKISSNCGVCHSDEDGNNSSNNHYICNGGGVGGGGGGCGIATPDSNPFNHHSNGEVTDNYTSHIQNTSDSSVINSNFVQTNLPSSNGMESENNSAMLLKETSDKSIRESVSDVNSSVVDTNTSSAYSVKSDENNVINNNNNCYDDSPPTKSCFNGNSGISALPVPAGWRRLLVDGSIIYLSPTNIALSSMEQVKMYLQTIGTCKCGLECPVNCDSVFNFNPKIISRPWDSSDSEKTRLCNHKRKAPVSCGPSSSVAAAAGPDKNLKPASRKEVVPTKRKKKKSGGSSSGVSVSQLLAQRDRALAAAAAAAARWSATAVARPGNVGYQNVVGNQYQSVQVGVKNPTQLRPQQFYEGNVEGVADTFKRETPPARGPDDKVAQFPCINVINNSAREGTVVNANEMSQMPPENHSAGIGELIRSSQSNLLTNQRQDVGQGVINHGVGYNQCGQEFVQNAMLTQKPEGGVVFAPQGVLFPSNLIMQRPRSIPPWHQTRLGLTKKPVPEMPVVYEKVPYIQQQQQQQHMPPPTLILEDATSRKKHKSNSKVKKASQEPPPQNQPSFMENPSAYLAQQTALLHNTISRPNFNILADTRPVTQTPQNPETPLNTSAAATNSGVLVPSSRNAIYSIRSATGHKVDQSNFTQSQVCAKNKVSEKENVSDSAEVSSGNVTCSNGKYANCKNSCCFFGSRNEKENSARHQIGEKVNLDQEASEKAESNVFGEEGGGTSEWNEEETNSAEENPVTSSTEKVPSACSQRVVADSRPIQGGTVSTSNGSPQPQPSPNCLSGFKQEVSSSKHLELICQSAAVGNVQPPSANSHLPAPKSRNQEKEAGSKRFSLRPVQSLGNVSSRPSLDGGRKIVSRSHSTNVTISSSQGVKSNFEGHEEQGKAQQSVTSSLDVKVSQQQEGTEAKGNRFVRTMASGHTASSNTITSVQAGRTQTATVTVSNNSAIPPPTMSLINLSNQNLVQIAQKGNSAKSPLEMVQSVVSSIQTPAEVGKNHSSTNSAVPSNKTSLPASNSLTDMLSSGSANVSTPLLAGGHSNAAASVLKTSPGALQAGHILVSSNGQYLVASNGNVIPQTNLSGLKLNQANSVPPMNASPVVTNVTQAAVTQVLPATVGVAQQVLGQSTVLVNALPAPFVIQPGVMAVETGLGRLAVATGNVLQSNVLENNSLRNSVRGVVPPEKVKYKKGSKKRKNQVTSVVQMQSPNNIILNQPFGQQNFAVSPGGNVQPLQALTLVQGKHGQIVMNNQNNFSQFNSQPQQINLLQPVNLTSVPNFPAFQQFIVPGLGNMVMSTDGTTTILPDANIGVQLQLQNVNGQNVLTPVQNAGFLNGHGILTTPTGMFIRAPNNQQKIIQNNASPQFLSPNNGQFLVNQFQGQLSPLITANLSPNQQIFTNSPQRQSPQEFIQIIPPSSSQNTTVVQQNTTIVQQQTTMVSNNQNLLNGPGKSGNFILSSPTADKPVELQTVGTSGHHQAQPNPGTGSTRSQQQQHQRGSIQEKVDFGSQHSVSTQTSVAEESAPGNPPGVTTSNTFCQTSNPSWSGSPPDTTTLSPVESEAAYDLGAPSPADGGPTSGDQGPRQAMVQCVSSSIGEGETEAEPSGTARASRHGKGRGAVGSSTVLQETGLHGYVSSKRLKPTVDECVVSSHSDVNVQEKRVEVNSNITSYHEGKLRLVDAALAENKSDDLEDEGMTADPKEKLTEGDLVWGPVRGSPAWPGKLVGPISPGGRALVRWFGGHTSPTRVDVAQLQSLSQGLDAHHRASNKGRKNRKLNVGLEAAIQEAMLELDRMTARAKKVSTGRGRPRRVLHR